MILVENLRKVFRTGNVEVQALRGVNLEVQPGEFISLVGPSGCGKSTLLHILGGLTSPSSGRVIVDGQDLGAMNEAQRTEMRRLKIGFIFQRFNLLPTLSAYGNIAIASHIAGNSNGSWEKDMKDAIRLLGLESRMKHRPTELSGGEQQRVAIARAIVNRPKILLADEPTGNLDTENSEAVMNILCDLNKNFKQTILLITHNQEIATFTDRIVNMRDGHILDN